MVNYDLSPWTLAYRRRVQELPIDSAKRAEAADAMDHAEASIDDLLALVARLQQALAGVQRALETRRERWS